MKTHLNGVVVVGNEGRAGANGEQNTRVGRVSDEVQVLEIRRTIKHLHPFGANWQAAVGPDSIPGRKRIHHYCDLEYI